MRQTAIIAWSLGLALGAGWPASAQLPLPGQNPDPRISATTNSLPSNELITVQNRYLRLDVRNPEIVQNFAPGTGGANPTPPTFNGYSNFRGGRAIISTIDGDPFTTADDGRTLLTGDWLAYAAVRLQNTPSASATAANTRIYEVESLYRLINDPVEDIIVSPPATVVNRNEITYSWQIREGHPTITDITRATVTLANGGLAGDDTPPLVLVKQSYRLVRDMVRCEVELTNISGQTAGSGVPTEQYLSVELYCDPTFGVGVNDGTAFYVDGYREGISREFLFPSTLTTDDSALRKIPASWRTFDDQTRPGAILGGIWDNDDIRNGALTAGVPTQVMFVDANQAGVTEFGYDPVRLDLTSRNWAVVARWVDVRLQPNQTRRFVTYFGLAGADSDFADPYGLSVEAPFSLELASGDDPGTATQEGADNVYRAPNPFTVLAAVSNQSTRTLSNIAVSLALPSGFSLADAGDTISKTVASIPAGSEQTVSWRVQCAAGQSAGLHTLTVSATGSGLASKVIERQIGIPALPTLDFPSITRRLDMISVPYDFVNRDLENVLGSLGNLGVTGGGNAAVARYNPSILGYAFFPDSFITNLEPGMGFWLFNGSLADINLPADRSEIPTSTQVGLGLTPSWNQIGCPYTVPTRLFDTQVVTATNVIYTFANAVDAGIVRPVLYEYSPHPTDPSQAGRYLFSGDGSTLFNPWRGYWLKVLQPVTLVYTANSLIGPFRATGPDYLKLTNGWEIGLTAEADEGVSQTVKLGQDSGSRAAYDPRDVDLPPEIRGGSPVRLAVVHDDWGRNNGAYVRDIQGPSSRPLRWRLRAVSDEPNREVALRWNLREAPADVQFTLVDLQTGARRHMRTTSGYVYNSGPFAGGREFTVTAERRSAPALAVAHMQATATRGRAVNVAFALTNAATVEVVIESPTGRRVRTVATGLEAVAGQNHVVWDGLDEQRRPVPSGQYRCRVLVHTADGQQAIAERIVVLNR